MRRAAAAPAARWPWDDSRSEGSQHLVGGALAGAHRAVHVAVPVGGGLGARPVDPSHRRPQRRAVLAEHPGWVDAHRAAAGPLLAGPRELHAVDGLQRLLAEQVGEGLEDRLLAVGGRALAPLA